MSRCLQCNKETDNPKFCCRSCSGKFTNKGRSHSLKSRIKVSNTLKTKYPGHGNVTIVCKNCRKEKEVSYGKRNQEYCSIKCRALDKDYAKKLSIVGKKRCSGIKEKLRLREIGRKGGFGFRGHTKNGNRYESLLEKNCFEFLEDHNIKFTPHKPILKSSKVSDIYLVDNNLWIELDGVNRERRKKYQCWKQDYQYWKNKIKLYKKFKLKYRIIYNLSEFKKLINNLYVRFA
jgi:hypothetical protein